MDKDATRKITCTAIHKEGAKPLLDEKRGDAKSSKFQLWGDLSTIYTLILLRNFSPVKENFSGFFVDNNKSYKTAKDHEKCWSKLVVLLREAL